MFPAQNYPFSARLAPPSQHHVRSLQTTDLVLSLGYIGFTLETESCSAPIVIFISSFSFQIDAYARDRACGIKPWAGGLLTRALPSKRLQGT